MNSAPAVATSPSSPTFAFALSRHYSQDCSKWGRDGDNPRTWSWAGRGRWARCGRGLQLCPLHPLGTPSAPARALQSPVTVCFVLFPLAGSIKAGRRSSYLLAITTERSKSCDDGLNTFRDEGKILR